MPGQKTECQFRDDRVLPGWGSREIGERLQHVEQNVPADEQRNQRQVVDGSFFAANV